MQLEFVQFQARYQSVEIRMVLRKQKPYTQYTADQSLLCTPCNKIKLDIGIERTCKLIGI